MPCLHARTSVFHHLEREQGDSIPEIVPALNHFAPPQGSFLVLSAALLWLRPAHACPSVYCLDVLGGRGEGGDREGETTKNRGRLISTRYGVVRFTWARSVSCGPWRGPARVTADARCRRSIRGWHLSGPPLRGGPSLLSSSRPLSHRIALLSFVPGMPSREYLPNVFVERVALASLSGHTYVADVVLHLVNTLSFDIAVAVRRPSHLDEDRVVRRAVPIGDTGGRVVRHRTLESGHGRSARTCTSGL